MSVTFNLKAFGEDAVDMARAYLAKDSFQSQQSYPLHVTPPTYHGGSCIFISCPSGSSHSVNYSPSGGDAKDECGKVIAIIVLIFTAIITLGASVAMGNAAASSASQAKTFSKLKTNTHSYKELKNLTENQKTLLHKVEELYKEMRNERRLVATSQTIMTLGTIALTVACVFALIAIVKKSDFILTRKISIYGGGAFGVGLLILSLTQMHFSCSRQRKITRLMTEVSKACEKAGNDTPPPYEFVSRTPSAPLQQEGVPEEDQPGS